MPDALYDRDVLAWAEQQAGLLRRVQAGERLNESVDWDHLIEEVQDLGLSELRTCRSLLRQALIHLMKLRAWPKAEAADHWRMEAAGFLIDARDRFAPSMRQRIDLQDVFADALYAAFGPKTLSPDLGDDGEAIAEFSTECPFSLDDLLREHPDIHSLVLRLRPSDSSRAF